MDVSSRLRHASIYPRKCLIYAGVAIIKQYRTFCHANIVNISIAVHVVVVNHSHDDIQCNHKIVCGMSGSYSSSINKKIIMSKCHFGQSQVSNVLFRFVPLVEMDPEGATLTL